MRRNSKLLRPFAHVVRFTPTRRPLPGPSQVSLTFSLAPSCTHEPLIQARSAAAGDWAAARVEAVVSSAARVFFMAFSRSGTKRRLAAPPPAHLDECDIRPRPA